MQKDRWVSKEGRKEGNERKKERKMKKYII